MISRQRFLLYCVIAICCSGCGGTPSLPQVKGKVSVKGKPAEGAVLLFHPQTSESKKIATAVASSDGTFTLITDLIPGIPVGNYKVTISWPDPSVKPTEKQKMMGDFEPGPDLLKGKYSSKNSTTLSAEIASTTTELPPFEL